MIRNKTNIDLRYIYYEVHQLSDGTKFIEGTREVKNSNALLFNPQNLNSLGIWEFRHVTHRSKDILIVDQFWIDLLVFKYNDETKIGKDIASVAFNLTFKR